MLGWDLVYAYNEETFGPEGLLGRTSDRDVVLTRTLGERLLQLNPDLPDDAYRDAIRQLVEWSAAQSTLSLNQDKYALLKDGVPVSFRDSKGEMVRQRLQVFDFDEPANNHFLAVRELWVRGDLYRRRTDIVGFVNGIPLLFMELKNIHKDIRHAFEKNFADYKDTVPHLFHHNAFIVLANGSDARIGSVSARFEHFHEWKRLEESEPGAADMETLRQEFERSPSKHSTVQALKQVVETRLSRMLARNPLRADLQRHYEEIVEDYNREKDRVTIENTFAALLKFVQSLDDEETRAMREGLDEESLALFDLLLKPGLDKTDIQRIKKVAAELLSALKGEKLKIENWRDKEATRDAVQVTIHDFLWAESTGLPAPAYSEDDVEAKTRDVYRHVHRIYPSLPSPFYATH